MKAISFITIKQLACLIGATNLFASIFGKNIYRSKRFRQLNIYFSNSIHLIKEMEAKTIWKIRQLTLHFWKATKERVAWYQTILYSLAESLILEDISGFWLTFMYLFCVRGTNYKPNVFRTEMYKTISANKSSTFWKLRYQFRNQISSSSICIFKMAVHVKINMENVRTFDIAYKTKHEQNDNKEWNWICSDHVDIFLNY